jgi:hypothetical protein
VRFVRPAGGVGLQGVPVPVGELGGGLVARCRGSRASRPRAAAARPAVPSPSPSAGSVVRRSRARGSYPAGRGLVGQRTSHIDRPRSTPALGRSKVRTRLSKVPTSTSPPKRRSRSITSAHVPPWWPGRSPSGSLGCPVAAESRAAHRPDTGNRRSLCHLARGRCWRRSRALQRPDAEPHSVVHGHPDAPAQDRKEVPRHVPARPVRRRRRHRCRWAERFRYRRGLLQVFSALGNTDALATNRRMSRPDIGFAMTPTVASATSRWRLTRQPLACCSPIALPARRRRACRLRDTHFRSR